MQQFGGNADRRTLFVHNFYCYRLYFSSALAIVKNDNFCDPVAGSCNLKRSRPKYGDRFKYHPRGRSQHAHN